ETIVRPRPLSVVEAARELRASEAYVRRLLATQRLFGIKVGPVWGIYPEDLASFMRMRRPPGRPRKAPARPPEEQQTRRRIERSKATSGTGGSLLQPHKGQGHRTAGADVGESQRSA